MKTLLGYDLEQVRTLLDTPLPPQAYKAVPGAGNFTDIDSTWQYRVFNSVFGLCGFGWGYDFNASDLEMRYEAKANGKGDCAEAVLKKLVLWFKLVDGQGVLTRHEIPAGSANKNEMGNGGYAMKGAITSALGSAASKMGWQESIYMGIRSHSNPGASAPARPAAANQPDPAATLPPPVTTTPQPKDPPPANPMRFFRCFNGHVISEYQQPAKCSTCGATTGLEEYPTLESARKGPAPLPPQSQPPATATPSTTPVAQPVTDVSVSTGGVASVSPGAAAAPSMQFSQTASDQVPCFSCGVFSDIKTGVCHACRQPIMRESDTKALYGEIKRLVGGDRGAWLRCASEATGKKIGGYSELLGADCVATIRFCRAKAVTTTPPVDSPPVGNAVGSTGNAGAGSPVPPAASAPPAAGADEFKPSVRNMSKMAMVKCIFDIGRTIGLATAEEVLKEISGHLRKPVTSCANLSLPEIEDVLTGFEYVAHQQGAK